MAPSRLVPISAELLRKSASSLIVGSHGKPCNRLPLRDPFNRTLVPARSFCSALTWPFALFRRRRLLDFGLLSRATSAVAVALVSNKANLPPTDSVLPVLAIVVWLGCHALKM